MTETDHLTTVQEYVQKQAEKKAESNPEIVALFEEQQEIERLEKELELRKQNWDKRVKAVGPYADKNYRITDLRETRMIYNPLLEKNFHDVWEKAIPQDKFLIESLKRYLGVDEICRIVKAMDEDEYNRQKYITLSEFDKATGDSSAKKKYVGVAYHLIYTPTKKTRIVSLYIPEMMKFPAKQYGQNQLAEIDEDEQTMNGGW